MIEKWEVGTRGEEGKLGLRVVEKNPLDHCIYSMKYHSHCFPSSFVGATVPLTLLRWTDA